MKWQCGLGPNCYRIPVPSKNWVGHFPQQPADLMVTSTFLPTLRHGFLQPSFCPQANPGACASDTIFSSPSPSSNNRLPGFYPTSWDPHFGSRGGGLGAPGSQIPRRPFLKHEDARRATRSPSDVQTQPLGYPEIVNRLTTQAEAEAWRQQTAGH